MTDPKVWQEQNPHEQYKTKLFRQSNTQEFTIYAQRQGPISKELHGAFNRAKCSSDWTCFPGVDWEVTCDTSSNGHNLDQERVHIQRSSYQDGLVGCAVLSDGSQDEAIWILWAPVNSQKGLLYLKHLRTSTILLLQ